MRAFPVVCNGMHELWLVRSLQLALGVDVVMCPPEEEEEEEERQWSGAAVGAGAAAPESSTSSAGGPSPGEGRPKGMHWYASNHSPLCSS